MCLNIFSTELNTDSHNLMDVKLSTTLIVVRKMCEIKIYEILKPFNY